MRSAMTICISLSLLSARVTAAQGTFAGTLDGVVKSVRGAQPAGGIRIRLQRFGITIQEKFSDDGRFRFGSVAPGPYTVVVDAPDFETATTSVEVPSESFVLIGLQPVRNQPQKAETRSLLVYLFEANRLDEAESLALRLHRNGKHSPDVHLVLGKIYLRKGRKVEMVRELELFVKEAPPGPLREEAERILSGR